MMRHPLLKAVRLLSPKKPILTPMLQEFFFVKALWRWVFGEEKLK